MIKENPDLEVKFLVDTDELCDDYIYTHQQITSIKIEPWIVFNHTEYDYRIFTDFSKL